MQHIKIHTFNEIINLYSDLELQVVVIFLVSNVGHSKLMIILKFKTFLFILEEKLSLPKVRNYFRITICFIYLSFFYDFCYILCFRDVIKTKLTSLIKMRSKKNLTKKRV